jgi:chorismate mutase/prephenate dehydratase
MTKTELKHLRSELEKIDERIISLFEERAKISVAIGKLKQEHGLNIYDPAQEAKVYAYLEKKNKGLLPTRALKAIFREIISISRELQSPITVAHLGPEASFAHMAALSHFGTSARFFPQANVFRVFDEIERGKVQWGVVPVENSLEGSVNLTLDRLILTPLKIRAEIFLKISHCLLSSGDKLEAISKIYSHPQAFAQCQSWLRANLPAGSLIETESTASAAHAVLGDKHSAAIGSRLAATAYGLNVLSEGIEDNPSNTTRFLVIGKGENTTTGKDKMSMLFATPHSPGALCRALAPFAERDINLLKIESYPVKEKTWDYLFFVDVSGHQKDLKIRECLKELQQKTTFLKILGSYPWGEGAA